MLVATDEAVAAEVSSLERLLGRSIMWFICADIDRGSDCSVDFMHDVSEHVRCSGARQEVMRVRRQSSRLPTQQCVCSLAKLENPHRWQHRCATSQRSWPEGNSCRASVFPLSLHARYEGTGRSLSLKLLQQLRAEGAKLASGEGPAGAAASGRTFREVQLQEPIRYGRNIDMHI